MLKYNEDNIKELLLRFTEGQTTEAEEEVLKDYFTHSKHIPEEWEAYKDLFSSFDTDAYDFTQEEVDAMFMTEPAKKRAIWPWLSIAGIAACLILVFTLYPRKSADTLVADNNKVETKTIPVVQEKVTIAEEKTTCEQPATPSKPKARKAVARKSRPMVQPENPLKETDTLTISGMTAEEYVKAMIAANMQDLDNNIFNDPIEFQSKIRAKGMELSARAYKAIKNQEL